MTSAGGLPPGASGYSGAHSAPEAHQAPSGGADGLAAVADIVVLNDTAGLVNQDCLHAHRAEVEAEIELLCFRGRAGHLA